MSKKRKQHTAEFKAMIGMEALKGIKTINEIAREHNIHPVQVGQWKKELKERLPEKGIWGQVDNKSLTIIDYFY
jgi:transposase-like protein